MKKSLIFLLCCAILFTFSGCGNTKQELTLLTWEDYVPQEILQEFTQQTGIQVQTVTAQTNEEMLEFVRKDPSAYDLVIATDYVLASMAEEGLLQKINYKKMPNYKYVSDGYKNNYYDPENQFTVPYSTAGILLAYDKEKAPIEIDAFADLLAPELSGMTVYVDDVNAITGIANLILEKEPNYTGDLADTKNILKILAQGAHSADAEYPENALASGDALVGVMFTSQLGYAMSVNPNLEIVYPKEGFIYTIDAMAIPANADGAKCALELMNYIHDPVVNGKIMPQISCSTTNVSAVQFMEESYRTSAGYNIDPDKAKEGVLFKPLDEAMQKVYNQNYKATFKDYLKPPADPEPEQ